MWSFSFLIIWVCEIFAGLMFENVVFLQRLWKNQNFVMSCHLNLLGSV